MVMSPAVLALLGCSALLCATVVVVVAAGVGAAARWRPENGGARQLARERRILLVEAALKVVLACQLASLALFVIAADRLHPLFSGAMCAAGTLGALLGAARGAAFGAARGAVLGAPLQFPFHRCLGHLCERALAPSALDTLRRLGEAHL